VRGRARDKVAQASCLWMSLALPPQNKTGATHRAAPYEEPKT